ncbi:MAG TPA: amidohydrolase family protein [Casimicrobiaceae bacterium]|nr:amidohydrolase family protein [Casimicrobiaceae bacterium]
MAAGRIVDCHAHIIDPVRFPFTGERGYQPRLDESGTREEFCAVLDRHGVAHGVLVQLSGYGTNNGAILDAMRAYPGRFKAIAMVDPMADDGKLDDLAAAGVVGVRFNLVSYDPQALARREASRLLDRIKALGWFAQVFADDAQWPAAAALLRTSGAQVLIDHFGVSDPAAGIWQRGFQAVLALGREGRATVKLSSPFRVARTLSGFDALDPFVEKLIEAFGVERCLWGSDWPFVNVPQRPVYADVLAPLTRWFPNASDRERVLVRNPQCLFGFGA